MGVFGDIMSAVFGHGSAAANAAASGGTAPPTSGAPPVDVTASLDKLAAAKKEKLEWKTSIVDLMKVLDLDSSLGARKQLAAELKYPGNTADSAAMNVWLHTQVMQKFAENGGKVPADIKH